MKLLTAFKIGLPLIIISVLYLSTDKSFMNKIQSIFKTRSSEEKLPAFKFSLVNEGKEMNTNEIKVPGSFLIIYFSPECPFCKEQLSEIFKDYVDLKNIPIYFLSPYPVSDIKEYFKGYDLQGYKNIIAGSDKSSYFGQFYGVKSIPYLAFYDKDQNLKNTIVGVTDTRRIKTICDSLNTL